MEDEKVEGVEEEEDDKEKDDGEVNNAEVKDMEDMLEVEVEDDCRRRRSAS